MAAHAGFAFRDGEALLRKAARLGLDIPFSEDISPLLAPAAVAGRKLANRLAVLPMECADAERDGGPSAWTFRRYRRYAEGGAGLIWFEAAAVSPDGRSNPGQLMLTEETEDGFKRLVEETRRAAARRGGSAAPGPVLILQLTHSGRFARPDGSPEPLIARHSPFLDPLHGLSEDSPVLSDEALDRIRGDFVNAAGLAASAGFDGVDIKACHGYLVSELLAGFTRDDSRYGGAFQNRTRFLLETLRLVRLDAPGLLLTSRLSAADMIPFPYGFGMDPEQPGRTDPREVKRLVVELGRVGVRFLALSIGVPAWKPHFGRPFDTPVPGGDVPGEHPLEGVARHLRLASEIQLDLPGTSVVGAGYSWLRRFSPNVGAAMIASGRTSIVGLGRGALAYPDFARDLADRGRLEPRKVCTTCSLCSHLLRRQTRVVCAVRDRKALAGRLD